MKTVTRTSEDKVKRTARNKIRRIEKALRDFPKLSNNKLMLERLEFWKKKI